MKYLFILLLVGCGGSSTKEPVIEPIIEPDNLYIVAGQSNATKCDWTHFENITGATVINIALSGNPVSGLIERYDSSTVTGLNPAGIIFVHGESDAMIKTDVTLYNQQVEEYRVMISNDVNRDLPLYISTVGYHNASNTVDFDALRNAVIEQSKVNELWFIAYDDAKNFHDWGMMIDSIHFNEVGCQVMMEGIAAYL